jgi:hypothetical protein
MPVFNVVSFKVKDGQDDAFLAAHRDGKASWPGLVQASIIKTGERSYCLIGEWSSTETLIAARPAMIKTLEGFRSLLDDLGDGRGVTDAVSGQVVLTI